MANQIDEFIDKIYFNQPEYTNKLKSILENSNNTDTEFNQKIKKLNHIKRIVLVSDKKWESITKQNVPVFFINPEDYEYKIFENRIKVTSEGESFNITRTNATYTVVLIRSGYNDENIKIMMDEVEKFGAVIVNNHDKVRIANDKYLLAQHLERYNINQPKYVLITKNDISKDECKAVEAKVKTIYDKTTDDTKYVCKILKSHGGSGVFICRYSNIVSILQCLFAIKDDLKILVQEYIQIDDGDIRVHVITMNGKQKIIEVSLRKKDSDDFRTNLSLGHGQIKNYKIDDSIEQLAKQAAAASGLIWAGIDIISHNGKNYVIEYNGAPGPSSETDLDEKEIIEENALFYNKVFSAIDDMI